MNQNKFFLPSLILPIAALVLLTLFKAYSLQSGLRFILPISGYDPVNPISGHYVTYRVDYGNDTCQDDSFKNDQESCICLKLGEAANHYLCQLSEDFAQRLRCFSERQMQLRKI
jgi:hypothetical protein